MESEQPMMTFCFWCPTCGWLESKDDHAATCKHRPFGFCSFSVQWRDDRDDLAMALELADLLTLSGERGDDIPDDYNGEPHCELDGGPGCDQCVADWLRAEVIAVLRGER